MALIVYNRENSRPQEVTYKGKRTINLDSRDNHIQDIAKYYMEVHGLSQISYHYGVIDNMKTLYFMF